MRIMGVTSLATFLISLINHIFPSHVYSLMVSFIANAISLLPQRSASHTLSLCLSAIQLSFPFLPFDIKKTWQTFPPDHCFEQTILNHTVYVSIRGLLTIKIHRRCLYS
jgi:hypothetical protein